jgi:hypothetical protein
MLTSVTSLILNIREIKKICEIKINLHDIILFILTGAAAWLASLAAGNLLVGAPPFVRAIGIVTACFGAMAGLSSIAFKGRAET